MPGRLCRNVADGCPFYRGRLAARLSDSNDSPNPTFGERRSMGRAEPKPRDLGSDRGYRVAIRQLAGLGEGVFVGAGAVDGGDGDLEKAQVDGELAAMVIPVVEHDVA
jgi:hypothetical protein